MYSYRKWGGIIIIYGFTDSLLRMVQNWHFDIMPFISEQDSVRDPQTENECEIPAPSLLLAKQKHSNETRRETARLVMQVHHRRPRDHIPKWWTSSQSIKIRWWEFLYPSTQRHYRRLISLIILLHVSVEWPSSSRNVLASVYATSLS
jgi:hypothetical protein